MSDAVADPAAEAEAWLEDNGYDVSAFGIDRLEPYLEAGMNLIAFRLTKGTTVGSIRPIRLSFGRGLPSIPIRPTAVAAEDDMGVLVWLLGWHRGVPANYGTIELNDAALNWNGFISPSAYDAFVTRAANEAGGQAFVTEFAGPSADVRTFLQRFVPPSLDGTRARDWTGQEADLLITLARTYGAVEGFSDVLQGAVELDGGLTFARFSSNPQAFFDADQARPVAGLDVVALLDEVQDLVIDPFLETISLFRELPYLTRLYTTISPDEMTLDPVFDFHGSLPDVEPRHLASRTLECSTAVTTREAPARFALPDGSLVRQPIGEPWPFDPADPDPMPAVSRVLRYGTSGAGSVLVDNTEAIATRLEEHNAGVPGPPPDDDPPLPDCLVDQGPPVDAGPESRVDLGIPGGMDGGMPVSAAPDAGMTDEPGGSLCAVGAPGAPDPSWALVALAVAFALRRRRP